MKARGDRKPDQAQSSMPCAKKPYAKPVLVDYGDVRDTTLAPTPGLYTESWPYPTAVRPGG